MALTEDDRAEIKNLIWATLVDCRLAEEVNPVADPMVKRMFHARVLPFLKGQLRRTREM